MFRFKQFVIKQDQCAMKVSTDGILFGGWCQPKSSARILDIGTGTGLLSLMLAQKTSADTKIVAVEIEPGAAHQAKHNVLASPWLDKIQVVNGSIQKFASQADTTFDVIISNPPWFEYSPSASHNKQNQTREPSRTLARQQTGLSLSEILKNAEQLLIENGELYLMLPSSAEENFQSLLTDSQFQLSECCNVCASVKHPAHCQMWRLIKKTGSVTKSNTSLVIKDDNQAYSKEFREICKDYYLNF